MSRTTNDGHSCFRRERVATCHMRVEVVTVGDELLRGDTVNTNAAWLGRQLANRGVTVTRITVVPDEIERIAAVVAAARDRADAVIVTGGLGPTHDDRTMPAIAESLDRELVEHEGARAWIAEHTDYDVDDLTPGTLALPAGAAFIPNEVGVAPGAVVDTIYVLPGVPAEMRAMFGHVVEAFIGEPRHEAVVDTPLPERSIAATLEELEASFDVTVGSYPGETVTVRIYGSDEATVEAAAEWLETRLSRQAGDG